MEKAKKSKIIRTLEITGGTLLLIVGIVGLFLPGLQGVLMIFGGIMLLFPVAGKKIIVKVKKFFKKIREKCSS